MRILGREFGRSRQITTGQAEPETEGGLPIIREKAARIVSTPSGPWMPIVRESFSGAWQQNVEVNQTAVLAFTDYKPAMSIMPSIESFTGGAVAQWTIPAGSGGQNAMIGLNGTNGSPGAPGANGQPTYVHIAYSSSANGSANFSLDDPTGRTYVGFYVDQIVADSGNPAAYAWSLVKGEIGAQGPPGLSAPQPTTVTGSGSALAPILLTAGQTLSIEAGVGVQSNQAGNATLQLLASLGSGGFNVVGSGSTYVGPGEPGYAIANGSITNTTGATVFANVRVGLTGPSGYAVTAYTTNYLKAS